MTQSAAMIDLLRDRRERNRQAMARKAKTPSREEHPFGLYRSEDGALLACGTEEACMRTARVLRDLSTEVKLRPRR